MDTICRACGYHLVDSQDRCPECGEASARVLRIACAPPSDVTWHGGWIGRLVAAAIACSMMFGGSMAAFGGYGAMKTLIGGGVFLVGLLLAVAAFGHTVERLRAGKRYADSWLLATMRVLWIDPDSVVVPAAAVDALELRGTQRPDRWWLVIHVSPVDAVLEPPVWSAILDEEMRGWSKDIQAEEIQEDILCGPECRVLLLGDRAEAETVRGTLEAIAIEARRARLVVDDALVASLFPGCSAGKVIVRGSAAGTMIEATAEGFRLAERGRVRAFPWSKMTAVAVALDHPRGTTAVDGEKPSLRWRLALERAPRRIGPLTHPRRAVSLAFEHEDQRAGMVLRWALSRWLPAGAGRSCPTFPMQGDRSGSQ